MISLVALRYPTFSTPTSCEGLHSSFLSDNAWYYLGLSLQWMIQTRPRPCNRQLLTKDETETETQLHQARALADRVHLHHEAQSHPPDPSSREMNTLNNLLPFPRRTPDDLLLNRISIYRLVRRLVIGTPVASLVFDFAETLMHPSVARQTASHLKGLQRMKSPRRRWPNMAGREVLQTLLRRRRPAKLMRATLGECRRLLCRV